MASPELCSSSLGGRRFRLGNGPALRFDAGGKDLIGGHAEGAGHPPDEARTWQFAAFLDLPDIFAVTDHILRQAFGEA